MRLFLYALIVFLILFYAFLAIKFVEYIYCIHRLNQPPLASSNRAMHRLVINQINTYYKNANVICEVGSGFGGLARDIAKNTTAKVYALENMPFSAFVSKVSDFFTFSRNKTVWCDAFRWLKDTDEKIDIAVAYLGPTFTKRLPKYKNKIRVIISLDFEIENLTPVRVIDLGYGNTIYNFKKYPHRVFVYEL